MSALDRNHARLEFFADCARRVGRSVWDLAHIGYFEELWLLRNGNGRAAAAGGFDELYDSFAHERAERGTLPILPPQEARAYVGGVREQVLERLPELARDDFLVGMVAQHELQHVETMAQTLALAGLAGAAPQASRGRGGGEVLVPGGPFTLGSDEPWAYDNERPGARRRAAGLPDRPRSRDERASTRSSRGGRTRRTGGDDERSRQPVQHVSFHEAEAYARWAGKRLPTEPEWEKAVKTPRRRARARAAEPSGSGRRPFFDGYPGFRAFPYAEYSEVFFGKDYRVLRGGSWVTDPLVARPTFRNWDLPERRQIFSGIRCASDA